MWYIAFPILSVCTAFILPLILFWYTRLRVVFFYKKVVFEKADYIFVEGLDGNI
jgi:hypothetical protein